MTATKIKVRLPSKFPSTVTVQSPVILTRSGASYDFSIDVEVLSESVAPLATAALLASANTWTATQTINKNAAAAPATTGVTAIPVLKIAGVDATNADIVIMGFGNGIAPAVRYLQSGGTAAAQTASGTGANLGVNFAYGYYTSVGISYKAGAGFVMQATENWTSTNTGARLDLYATPTGGTALAIGASVGAGFMVGDQTDPGAGAISATASIKSKSATAGIGYATGAGGAITQITSRTTGVTLDKITGAITLVSAAGSATYQSFTVTNAAVAATDVIRVCQKSGTDLNEIHVTAVAAGSFRITFRTTGGTTVEQPVFNFAVIKAVAA